MDHVGFEDRGDCADHGDCVDREEALEGVGHDDSCIQMRRDPSLNWRPMEMNKDQT